MPYIPQDRRDVLDDGRVTPQTSGELNYELTQVALVYLRSGEVNYARMAEVMSAFDCAAREFYRRVVAVYEDEKCRLNGDVY